MKYFTVLSLLAAAVSAQTTHVVMVGGLAPPSNGGAATPILGYSPESITAAQGDIVQFVFMQKNHTATQSTFAEPCVKMAGGQDSGFMANPTGSPNVTWQMTVPNTDPIWMFCGQTGHCAKGMVFSINAAVAGNKTFTAYKQLAINQNGTNLAVAAIAQPNAAAQAAPPSPVTVAATAGNGALNSQATVAAGQGTDANGQACSCSCLCGQNSFPQNAAMGSFGGFAGMIGA